MAIGPLGRIVAQFVVVAASSVGRAMLQYFAFFALSHDQLTGKLPKAYRDAAKRGSAGVGRAISQQQPLSLRSRMTTEEARRILGLDSVSAVRGTLSAEEVKQRHRRLYEINAPSGRFAGSPYLQKKVDVARTILLEDLAQRTTDLGRQKKATSGANRRN